MCLLWTPKIMILNYKKVTMLSWLLVQSKEHHSLMIILLMSLEVWHFKKWVNHICKKPDIEVAHNSWGYKLF